MAAFRHAGTGAMDAKAALGRFSPRNPLIAGVSAMALSTLGLTKTGQFCVPHGYDVVMSSIKQFRFWSLQT